MRKILPTLLAWITGHKRHQVKNLELDRHSIVANLFRLWELIFWRRVGKSNKIGDTIRAERSTAYFVDKNTKKIYVTHTFYTFEALTVHIEQTIYNYIKSRVKETYLRFKYFKWEIDRAIPQLVDIFNILQPQFSYIGHYTTPATKIQPKGYSFAIATDTQSAFTFSNTGTMTQAYTCSGSDRILFVGAYTDGASATAAYNSVSMSQVGTRTMPTISHKTYLWLLVAPATGSNNVVLSSVGGYCASWASSYTGAAQTGQPDASNTAEVNTGTTIDISVTTTANNCWAVMAATAYQGGSSAGTNTTMRVQYSNWGGNFDTNGVISPAGSRTLQATSSYGSGEKWCGVMASFAPVAGTAYTKSITETVALVETVKRGAGKAVEEVITLVDTVRRSMTRTITDVITLVETTTKNLILNKNLSDVITLVETTRARISAKVIKETITLVETLRVYIGTLRITETITVTDTLTKVRQAIKNIAETISLNQTIANVVGFGRHFTESISLTVRLRGLRNGLNMLYNNKYTAKVGSYFKKYIDPK